MRSWELNGLRYRDNQNPPSSSIWVLNNYQFFTVKKKKRERTNNMFDNNFTR